MWAQHTYMNWQQSQKEAKESLPLNGRRQLDTNKVCAYTGQQWSSNLFATPKALLKKTLKMHIHTLKEQC